MRLPPHRCCLYALAGIGFEDGETSDRVGEVEWASLIMGPIVRQGFVVTGFGQNPASPLPVNVAEVADRVSKQERLVLAAKNGDRLLVVPAGGVTIDPSFKLAQISEDVCQFDRVVFFPQDGNGALEVSPGIRRPPITV